MQLIPRLEFARIILGPNRRAVVSGDYAEYGVIRRFCPHPKEETPGTPSVKYGWTIEGVLKWEDVVEEMHDQSCPML